MSVVDSTDVAILVAVAAATAAFFFWRSSSSSSSSGSRPGASTGGSAAKTTAVAKGSPQAAAGVTTKNGKKSIIGTLSQVANPNKLVLFYGSQTGTAEDLASRVAKEAASTFNLHTLVADLEEYDLSELTRWPHKGDGEQKWLTGFFMATYGEGEPTDNAIEFYDWVMDGKGKGDDEDVEDESDPMVEEKVCAGLPFVVFGLGNKTYEHFNAVSRRLNRRLLALGAKRVGPSGEGDDDGSLEDDFLAWKPKLFESLAEFYGVAATSGREHPHVPMFVAAPFEADSTDARAKVFHGELSAENRPRRWKRPDGEVSLGGEGGERFVEMGLKKRQAYSAKHPYFGRIAHSRPLFTSTVDEFGVPAHLPVDASLPGVELAAPGKVRIERQCVHMEFDLEGSGLRYEAGDHVGLLACNSEREVVRLAEVLAKRVAEGWAEGGKGLLEATLKLVPNSENPGSASAKTPFPSPCKVKTALTHYLAITAPLKQHQLEILAKYATDEAEKTALFELVDNRDLFVERIETPQKNLREVLEAFASVKIPLGVILGEVLTHVQPRFYSISSSSRRDPTRVSVTAVVVRYVLPSPDAKGGAGGVVVYKEGLATSMIQRLHETSVARAGPATADTDVPAPPLHVPLFIRTSSFRLPRDPALPVVMVGPGTGVAPFRGFVQERLWAAESGKNVGPTWLFYGCRHPEQDHLYRDEFAVAAGKVEGWKTAGETKAFDLRFFNAFSRYAGKKVYVQHLVREMGAEVWEMLNAKRGYFYICGDAKHMAADVQQCLVELAMEKGGKNEAGARAWLKTLRTTGRYQEDVW
ncbi:NADPH-cytochrome P450 reductase [Phlyctochytrium bullatum]|nr:NADPH-cytochrome P450 reductase [Phlyctochytrium bullatum]